MNELLIAVLSIAGSAIGAWVAVKVAVAKLEVRMQHVEAEIGDRSSGLRGSTHKLRGQAGVLAQQIDLLREKQRLPSLNFGESFRKDDD